MNRSSGLHLTTGSTQSVHVPMVTIPYGYTVHVLKVGLLPSLTITDYANGQGINMSTYIVTLLLRLGEYEKSTQQLIEAASQDDAEYTALCGETHNEPLTRVEYDRGDEWWDDCSIYEVQGVKVVAPEHVNILKLYM